MVDEGLRRLCEVEQRAEVFGRCHGGRTVSVEMLGRGRNSYASIRAGRMVKEEPKDIKRMQC